MYFSCASILLYSETRFVPVHYDLRSPLFSLESRTCNFSFVCVIETIFSVVEDTNKDEQNARGEEACFSNTGNKWIIQIGMTGHALTDSPNRSFSSILILPAISQERLSWLAQASTPYFSEYQFVKTTVTISSHFNCSESHSWAPFPVRNKHFRRLILASFFTVCHRYLATGRKWLIPWQAKFKAVKDVV